MPDEPDPLLDLSDAVLDPLRDLVLGSTCLGCGRPGRRLCRGCDAGLPVGGVPAAPSPRPDGLLDSAVAAAYDGLVRDLVVAHKEHGARALTRPLGRLLAGAVRAALAEDPVWRAGSYASPGPAVLLVPVPSRRATVRRRGEDPLDRMTVAACGVLRHEGIDARVARLLAVRWAVADQAGLDAEARRRNLAYAYLCPGHRLRPWAGSRARVVLVDDVLTTGSTLREAQRALQTSGVRPAVGACVAATARRSDRANPLSLGQRTY